MPRKQPDKYKPRKDGRYGTKVSTGKVLANGSLERIPVYASSSKELETKVANMKRDMELGIYANDGGITFGTYAKKWVKVSKDSKEGRTREMYNNIIKNHIDLLEKIRIKDITRTDIQEQINARKDKPRICEQMKLTFRQILEDAADDGLVYRNACRKIELPKRTKSDKRALTKEEKTAIKKAGFTPLEKAYVYILFGCGCRPGEINALSVGDIDIKGSQIRFNKAIAFENDKPYLKSTKTEAGIRTVPMPPITLKALKEYLPSVKGIYLFTDKDGNFLTHSADGCRWNAMHKKIKAAMPEKKITDMSISKLTRYTFRHNFATECYYNVSMKKAIEYMGHEDAQMIMEVYAHMDAQKEKEKEDENLKKTFVL